MSRQLEQGIEDEARRRRDLLVAAVYGGLSSALEAEGHELLGFSCRLSAGDCLLTLRAENHEGKVVCFVGSEDLPDALIKAVREAKGGQLAWRTDRYAK